MIKARKRVETWGCRRRHTLWLNVNHKWVNGILHNTQDEGKKKKQNRMKDTKHQTYCTVIWKKGWVAHSSVIRPFTLVLVELKTTIATLAQNFFIRLFNLWWGMKGESPDQVLLKSPSDIKQRMQAGEPFRPLSFDSWINQLHSLFFFHYLFFMSCLFVVFLHQQSLLQREPNWLTITPHSLR